MSLVGLEQELTQDQLDAAREAAANRGTGEFYVPLDNPYNDAPLPEAIVLHAALLVDDASHRRKYNSKPDLVSLKRYQMYHQPWVLTVLRVVALSHLFLAFFEGYPDRASIPIFPKWATSFLEVLILAVYVADMLFKRSFLLRGTKKNRNSKWLADTNYYVTFVAIVLTFIDIALSLILRVGWPDLRYVRWSVFFRVWFTIYFFRDVRHYFKNLKKTLPEIAHVFAVFFGFIFFFVLMIMTLVQDGGGNEKLDVDFVNTFRSFISLYILSTTANFPDVLVRPYRISPLFAVIFVAYCIIVTKVMLSLITAVIYNRYKGYIQEDVKSSVKLRRIKLHTAFRLLDVYNRGKIFYNEWYQLMRVLRPDYNDDKIRLMYSIIDETVTGDLEPREFVRIVSLMRLKIESQRTDEKTDNKLARCCPSFYKGPLYIWLRRIVSTSGRFQTFMDIVVVLNAIQTIVYHEVSNISRDVRLIWDASLLGLYAFEMLLKIVVFGPGPYWANNWHKFDAISVFSSAVSLTVLLTGWGQANRNLVQFVLLLRSARLFRFMLLGRANKSVKTLYATMGRLIPQFAVQGLAAFCVFFQFGQLGMAIWGGEIYEGKPELVGSGYSSISDYGLYGVSNFNTFGNALLLLFEQMIQNNWHVVADAHERISSWPAWFFFIAFNLSTAVVFINILLAFVLDAFIEEWESVQNPKKSSVQRRIDQLAEQRKIFTEAAEQEILADNLMTTADEGYLKVVEPQYDPEIEEAARDEDLADDERPIDISTDNLDQRTEMRLN